MTPSEELGYKVGDKFIVLVKDEDAVGFTQGQTVTMAEDDGSSSPLFRGQNTTFTGEAYLSLYKVKKIEEQGDMNKDFTKNMLRTGMRVVHRNGAVGIILKDINVIALEGGYNKVENYSERLIVHSYDDAWDIMKVYEGYQNNRKVLDFNELGELIWERKEETEQQKQIKELKATIKKAQEQLEELKKSC